MGIFKKLFGRGEPELDQDLSGLGKFPSDESLSQDELGLDEKSAFPEGDMGTGLPSHLEEPITRPGQFNRPGSFTTSPITPAGTQQRDLELINSKLDTLKAILNSMDQRIANLEKAAGVEQQKKMPW